MVKVYEWPPVGVLSSKWTIRTPVARSRSIVSGARYMSAMRKERIAASVKVGGRSFDYTGHGYMESLKWFLEGGANLVKLTEIVEPYQKGFNTQLGVWPTALEWRGSTNQVITWRTAAGATLVWTAGELLPARVLSGSPRYIRVYGLTPGMVVIRPGQRVLAVNMPDGPHEQVFSTQRVVVDGSGEARIRTNIELPLDTTHAVINFTKWAVFEVEGKLPEVMSTVNEEPIWDWNFVQVFEEEVDGGFQVIDPW